MSAKFPPGDRKIKRNNERVAEKLKNTKAYFVSFLPSVDRCPQKFLKDGSYRKANSHCPEARFDSVTGSCADRIANAEQTTLCHISDC